MNSHDGPAEVNVNCAWKSLYVWSLLMSASDESSIKISFATEPLIWFEAYAARALAAEALVALATFAGFAGSVASNVN